MSVNGLSVGRDFQFGYYDAQSGTIIDLGDVQNVQITAQKHDIASRPYNAPPTYGYIPDGYKISFTITRTGSSLEDFQAKYESLFNSGTIMKSGFLNETTTNPDGSISRWQYTKFVFFVTDHGDISREKTITLKAEAMASEKVKIS